MIPKVRLKSKIVFPKLPSFCFIGQGTIGLLSIIFKNTNKMQCLFSNLLQQEMILSSGNVCEVIGRKNIFCNAHLI